MSDITFDGANIPPQLALPMDHLPHAIATELSLPDRQGKLNLKPARTAEVEIYVCHWFSLLWGGGHEIQYTM